MTLLKAIARTAATWQRPPLAQSNGRMGSFTLNGDTADGMESYVGEGAVYGPTRRIAEVVSLVKWSLYQQTGEVGKSDRQFVDDAVAPARHPVTALWTHPNDHMTGRFFLFLTQLYLDAGNGEAYWIIMPRENTGRTTHSGVQSQYELWPVNRRRLRPVPDPDRYISGYIYRLGMVEVPLEISQVVPLIIPDPRDPMHGAGPLHAIATDIESEHYAAAYGRNTFLNNAEPGGVITYEKPLSPDRWNEMVMRWREQHLGVNNARRVAILDGGATWQGNAQTNKDLEYAALRQFSQERVMYTEGVPYSVMQTKDVNLANAETGLKNFYRLTIGPRLELIKEAVNERVVPLEGEMLTLDYDPPQTEDEAFDIYAAMSAWLGGLITQNQALDGMGYGAIGPEGDRYVWEISGTPPAIPPAPAPPRRPTRLSYRAEKRHGIMQTHEDRITDSMGRRLAQVRQDYLDYVHDRRGN